MSRTTAKVLIGIWSIVFVLFAALFGYLWYNGGWMGLPQQFGWYSDPTYQTVHEQTLSEAVQTLDLNWKGGDVSIFPAVTRK